MSRILKRSGTQTREKSLNASKSFYRHMTRSHPTLPEDNRSYAAARGQLLDYLRTQGFKPHPNEVFCPSGEHCWVDVAAVKGQDYWAFEYKSRNDSIRRGFDQCRSYAKGFNYVVLVADRYRVTSSPYFMRFKHHGFGVWRHDRFGFQPLLQPRRRTAMRMPYRAIQRQFKRSFGSVDFSETTLNRWLTSPHS